jgi:uncharacterized cupin superfamily protein
MRSYDAPVIPEAPLEPTEHGLVQAGPGWFVVNARDARWRSAEGRGSVCVFGDEDELMQVGVNLFVLGSGEPMAMYHWEADQEDFLVLAGEALLIVEGEERPLRRWDFVHCPAGTKHVIVGAGGAPCVVLAVGAREHQGSPGWERASSRKRRMSWRRTRTFRTARHRRSKRGRCPSRSARQAGANYARGAGPAESGVE